MRETIDLLEATVEELFMLEQTISRLPNAECSHKDILGYLSDLIMTSSVRTGETMHCSTFEHEIPHQRVPEWDRLTR